MYAFTKFKIPAMPGKMLLVLGLCFFAGCDRHFEDINTDPAAATDLPPQLLFSTALLQGSFNLYQSAGAEMAYASGLVQHLAAVTFNWAGDKYLYDPFNNDALFQESYRNEVRTTEALLARLDEEHRPEWANLRAVSRIWRVFIFHRLTDLYGDVPYHRAGRGALEADHYPPYDAQEEIYRDLLLELAKAAAAIDPALGGLGAEDLLFDGDLARWRRFAYSLMLRLGLRLSRADPEAARQYTLLALEGGVMHDLADGALMRRTDGPAEINQNPIGLLFQVEDNQRLCATWVDWLRSHADPRLAVFSFVQDSGPPKGLPHGYDENLLANYPGGTDLDSYSRLHPALVKVTAPTVLQTLAEVELLRAEAAVRGWTTADAGEHFARGLRAALQQWTVFGQQGVVALDSIEAYVAANPLPAQPAAALAAIHEQYWAATFLNELEAYANWRRTGVPELAPTPFAGNVTGGVTPRRLRYPQREYSVNGANLQQAIDRQGPDDFLSRVWWDR
jgi:hypothetical protein